MVRCAKSIGGCVLSQIDAGSSVLDLRCWFSCRYFQSRVDKQPHFTVDCHGLV